MRTGPDGPERGGARGRPHCLRGHRLHHRQGVRADSLVYDRLRRARGAEAARLYAMSQQDAVERVAAIVDEARIACDLERVSAYSYAAGPSSREVIKAEARAAVEAGLAAVYVDETDLPFTIGGAGRLNAQAQFHPQEPLGAGPYWRETGTSSNVAG